MNFLRQQFTKNVVDNKYLRPKKRKYRGELKGIAIYLSMGTNLGDRKKNLAAARQLLENQLGSGVEASRVFESAPWGYASEHRFYNCCLASTTLLDPLSLMKEILQMERTLGRERGAGGYADRLIDIDLLFYGEVVMEHPQLILPHPGIARRRFVLQPLCDIAPDLVHPVNGLTIREMLQQCQDPGEVRVL